MKQVPLAIAWAKENFQTCSSEEWSIRAHETEHLVEMEGDGLTHYSLHLVSEN